MREAGWTVAAESADQRRDAGTARDLAGRAGVSDRAWRSLRLEAAGGQKPGSSD